MKAINKSIIWNLFWFISMAYTPDVTDCTYGAIASQRHFWTKKLYNELHITSNSNKVRIRRQIPSPLFVKQYDGCLSQSSCSSIRNMTSTASGTGNTFYVATPTRILKVRLGSELNPVCVCTVVLDGNVPVLSIVMDDNYIYWLGEESTEVMYVPIDSDNSLPLSKLLRPEMLAEDKQFHYAACRIPSYIPDVPFPVKISDNYAFFNLSSIEEKQHKWFNSAICMNELNPNISFAFLYKKNSDTSPKSCFQMSDCFYKRISSTASLGNVRLGNLSPNAEYFVHLIIYSESNAHKSAIISPAINFHTSCTVPAHPVNLACRSLNNSSLMLSWKEPNVKNSAQLSYEIIVNNTNKVDKILYKNGDKTRFIHNGIDYGSNNYTIKVSSYNCPANSQQFSQSKITGCKPYQPPVHLTVENTTCRHATVLWKAPDDEGVQCVIVEWIVLEHQNGFEKWSQSSLISGNVSFFYTVTDLEPNTGYSFRTKQQYVGYNGNEGWLYSAPVNGRTMPSIPDHPRNVRVVKDRDINFLSWEPPNDHGAPLEYYIIQYRNRSSPNATRMLFGTWSSELHVAPLSTAWEIYDDSLNFVPYSWYEFRVSAVNSVGEGDASKPSSPFQFIPSQDFQGDFELWIIIGGTGGLVMIILIIITFVACRRCGQMAVTYQTPPSSDITTIHLSYGADLQLAQLRHMTEIANYRGVEGVPPDYMDLLPLFPREKLSLTDFLGKGAFGEVFKGIAIESVGGINIEKKVAVKTLQEGSTDSEKCEFLMEAYFMSTFNHENILSLIGVCLDNEPQYLLLELMEGGDLLHYLRDARSDSLISLKLTMADLLDISLDVAAGCKYLEEQRFVHRDLAARNCLVSTKEYRTETRIVKIGDFGLARDIYKSDYYHKAGEGLLPVRWMAPESLVDNIYTSQSDVWSFGVLLWEILTFGQQPYPARTNIEVLQYVRNGGRLKKPHDCPDDFYSLMIKCWHNTPTLRPSFSWAVKWLQQFKDRNVASANEEDNYRFDLTNITSSEEDLATADEEIVIANVHPQPQIHILPDIEGFDNEGFELHESSSRGDPMATELDSDNEVAGVSMDDIPAYSFLPSPNDINLGSNYLLMSTQDMEFNERQPLSQGEINIGFQDEEDSEDANDDILNCAMLNFSTNGKQPIPTSSRFSPEVGNTQSLPSCSNSDSHYSRQPDYLLPYIGDLPITDEERLMRKQQWNRQRRLRMEEGLGDTSSEDSPTFTQARTSYSLMQTRDHQRLLNQNDMQNSLASTSDNISDDLSETTTPMKVFDSLESSHTFGEERPCSDDETSQETYSYSRQLFTSNYTDDDNESHHSSEHENPRVNIPTYV
uniref:proto-oncogene tyrosine-protein kinase ROS-like isoform X1 n=1 Tax=Styela clava TaxID=7725 RepID=UPI00193A4C46|nr:proto-oncogene tyrosine-protein kinase ROS-like isoform X1 [Styela clava]XP_039261486.1 proto-oncogene tyrosine-protein kinase ROS-like isoform X1 [Styela clava]